MFDIKFVISIMDLIHRFRHHFRLLRPLLSRLFFPRDSLRRRVGFVLWQPVLLFLGALLFQRGNTVKHDCGTAVARGLDRLPILPFGGKILVFGQARFLQIIGQGIGQLNLQLLQRRFVVGLRIQTIEIAQGRGGLCRRQADPPAPQNPGSRASRCVSRSARS